MRVHGWCTECHRVRLIDVSGPGLVNAARGVVASGVCGECRDSADERARIRSRWGASWQAELRLLALGFGLRVRAADHDAIHGWTVTLEDGREVEGSTTAEVRAGLARLRRR